MSKTGILITARLGSTRLPRKHLLKVAGKPVLSYLIERISREFRVEITHGDAEIAIVTSNEEINREFERFRAAGIRLYYGSIKNIPLRHLQAAKAFGLEYLIAIDGDDILSSRRAMRKVYTALNGNHPYVTTINLPLGMNVSGYSVACLEESLCERHDEILETGWGRIFEGADKKNIPMHFSVQDDLLRFTLDYPEDLKLFDAIITGYGGHIYDATDEDIVQYVLSNKLNKITEPIAEKYWDNFYQCAHNEIGE